MRSSSTICKINLVRLTVKSLYRALAHLEKTAWFQDTGYFLKFIIDSE